MGGGADCDTIEEMWNSLPEDYETNFFALLGEPDSPGYNDRFEQLSFDAIGFILDREIHG